MSISQFVCGGAYPESEQEEIDRMDREFEKWMLVHHPDEI